MQKPRAGGDPYENLANAIVIQAAEDYMSALKRLRKNRSNDAAMQEALQLERFFHSGWFGVLTSVDPDFLIRELRKKVSE
jgi:hypothetical protein